MNILIADDDEFLQKSLSYYLLQAGHTVSIAINGQAALEAIEKNKNIDALICDVNMPQLTGPGLILTLRKFYPQGLPKIIIVSGIKNGKEFMKQLEIPYDLYLEKPLDAAKVEELKAKLSH